MQALVEGCDHLTRVDVPQRAEIIWTKPLQEEGSVMRVGAQQANRAVPAPAPQHEMLVFGSRTGSAELQDCGRSVGRQHGQHER